MSKTYDADQARNKLMTDKLMDQVARGYVENEWAETFISDMSNRIKSGKPLSAKQVTKLEELFEKY